MVIKVTPLGSGCEVGRSCVIVEMGGRAFMFDCGLHMCFTDERRFPYFSWLAANNVTVDAVLISHFHMDHVGALVHFTEHIGFSGPVLASSPTKAITRLQLEDALRISPDNGSAAEIAASLEKIVCVRLHETFELFPDTRVRCFYAGHVLGAVMFHVECNGETVLYTGDYNTTPDRHLGPAALLPGVPCDVVITETTYTTTIRDSKRVRERAFIEAVEACVRGGGKVLIPVFALGRAQELCLLLDALWARAGLGAVPLLFSSAMVERANEYYRMFVDWTSESLRRGALGSVLTGPAVFAAGSTGPAAAAAAATATAGFEFRHVRQLGPDDRATLAAEGPVCVFSTPGMLQTGQALELFKLWCGDARNLVLIPGFCVEGTAGNDILTAAARGDTSVAIQGKQYPLRCRVQSLSFSAHADCRGAVSLLRGASPRAVVLVHGEMAKMVYFRAHVERTMGIRPLMPSNGTTVEIDSEHTVTVDIVGAAAATAAAALAAGGVVRGALVAAPGAAKGSDCNGRRVCLQVASVEDGGPLLSIVRVSPGWALDTAVPELRASLQYYFPTLGFAEATGTTAVTAVNRSGGIVRFASPLCSVVVEVRREACAGSAPAEPDAGPSCRLAWRTADDGVAQRILSLVDCVGSAHTPLTAVERHRARLHSECGCIDDCY